VDYLINLSSQPKFLSTLLQEMAWHQTDAMPFLAARLEHEEHLAVKYFALFAHFYRQKFKFISNIF